MNKEECVEFLSPEGLTIRGILHQGEVDKYRGVSLICLNTGLNDMTGWHRLQVKLSRYLADRGYNVLRFDDSGIGDSGGELQEESIVKIFSEIETGLFVPNADAAVDFMKYKCPKEKIVYLGFCGGGLTAIHSAAENENVSGIMDMGGPITLSSNEYLHKKDPWEVRKNVVKYRSKFFRIRPWINFFSGKGEYATIYKSVTNYIKHKFRGEYKGVSSSEKAENVNNLNRKFFRSFESYAKSKRPLLFYFAELDSATWEFKKYFSDHKDSDRWLDSRVTFIEVEGANHIFSSTESQQRMNSDLLRWLERYF